MNLEQFNNLSVKEQFAYAIENFENEGITRENIQIYLQAVESLIAKEFGEKTIEVIPLFKVREALFNLDRGLVPKILRPNAKRKGRPSRLVENEIAIAAICACVSTLVMPKAVPHIQLKEIEAFKLVAEWLKNYPKIRGELDNTNATSKLSYQTVKSWYYLMLNGGPMQEDHDLHLQKFAVSKSENEMKAALFRVLGTVGLSPKKVF